MKEKENGLKCARPFENQQRKITWMSDTTVLLDSIPRMYVSTGTVDSTILDLN